MIEVKMSEHGIDMNGHAMRSVNGQDIVCAAVSSLTCNLINSLNELSGDHVEYSTDSGKTTIKWQRLSDKGKLLVDSWFLGITAINQQYNCIEFI